MEKDFRDTDIRLKLSGYPLIVEGLRGVVSDRFVFDAIGKSHPDLDFRNFGATGKVDISPLCKGLYFLSIKSGTRRMAKGFVIP